MASLFSQATGFVASFTGYGDAIPRKHDFHNFIRPLWCCHFYHSPVLRRHTPAMTALFSQASVFMASFTCYGDAISRKHDFHGFIRPLWCCCYFYHSQVSRRHSPAMTSLFSQAAGFVASFTGYGDAIPRKHDFHNFIRPLWCCYF